MKPPRVQQLGNGQLQRSGRQKNLNQPFLLVVYACISLLFFRFLSTTTQRSVWTLDAICNWYNSQDYELLDRLYLKVLSR